MSNNLKKEFRKVHERLPDLDHAMATGLMTLACNTSANRQMMFFPNLTQFNQLENPERPLVTTGYENVFAHYSKIAYNASDRNVRIVGKVIKNAFNYILITYNSKTDTYDVVERQEATDLGESYGFRRNNEFIDGLEIGDKVQKGDVFYKSTGFDDDMNYGFGRNINMMYTINLNNLEDSITVTDDLDLDTNKVKVIEATISDNTIPLNLYGDTKEYKTFPEVGESVKDSVLFATRLKNSKSDLFKLKNWRLRDYDAYDTKYVTPGDFQVIDIDIYSNKGVDDLPDTKTHKQLKDAYRNIVRYRKELYKELKTIIDSGSEYTMELSYMFKQVRDFLDPSIKLSVNDKIFDKFIVQFTTMHKDHIKYGSKLVGRYGNKGVVGTIEKKKDYTYFIDHKGQKQKVQIKFDGLGILARLNPGQVIEHELNWIAAQALDRVWDDRKEFMNTAFRFLEIVNPEQEEAMKAHYKALSKKEKKMFYQSIQQLGLPIFLSPSKSVTLDQYEELIDEFNPQKYDLFREDKDGNRRYYKKPVIVGKSYVMFLKHTPLSKFSVRSRGSINPRNATPTRSNHFLKNKALFSDTANRIGEQEITILLYCNQPSAVTFLMSIYANSIENRKKLAHYLYESPLEDGSDFDSADFRNKTVDIINNQLNSVGLELDFKFEDPKEYAKRMKMAKEAQAAIKADDNKVLNIGDLKVRLKNQFKSA